MDEFEPLPRDELIDFLKRLDLFWRTGGLGVAVSDFIKHYCPQFEGREVGSEQSHELYKIYEEYCEIFEEKLSDFLKAEEMAHEEFYANAKEIAKMGDNNTETINFLLSALDYETFLTNCLNMNLREKMRPKK